MRILLLTLSIALSFILNAQHESFYEDLAQSRHNTFLKAVAVTPNSPTAASLGTFGEYPVDLYTGRVDISVPVYAISGNSLSLPINMSYNSGGIRVNTLPSWVGSGWNLAVGGVITRSVQGEADLKSNYYDRGEDINTLNSTTVDDYFEDRHKLQQEASGVVGGDYDPLDTQPDHYNFTFPGGGGKFYLLPNALQDQYEDDNGVMMKRSMDYQIRPNFDVNTGEIISFLIKDDKGNRYHYTDF